MMNETARENDNGMNTSPVAGANEKDIDPVLRPYLDNPYVKDIVGEKIFYRGAFYCEMYKLIESGEKAEDAYVALGFDVGVLGTNRASCAARRAKEKARNNTLRMDDDETEELSEVQNQKEEEMSPEWKEVLKHPYIKGFSGGKLQYQEEIYSAVREYRERGYTSVEAFEELGIPVSVVGVDRANSVGKRAMDPKYKEGFIFRPGNYDGTLSLDEILEKAKGLPLLLLISMLIARIIFLEALIEELKKKDVFRLGHKVTFVDRNLKYNLMRMVDTCVNGCAKKYGISLAGCLKIFGAAKSSYESYRKNKDQLDPNSRQAKEKEEDSRIITCMQEIVKKRHGNIPGKRTMKQLLLQDYNIIVGVSRVARLMKEVGLFPTQKKKDAYKGQAKYNHECSAKANLLMRDFFKGPRQVILTDITYLYFGASRKLFYLCTFMDAYTLEVLGWACSKKMDQALVNAAYLKMLDQHGEELNIKGVKVYVHSDQGSVYTSTSFSELLEANGFIQSVSRRANSQDNAPCESFFGTFKSYIMDKLMMCKTIAQAYTMVEGCIEFCNKEDAREVLGYLTPHEFFALHMTGIYPLDEYYGVKASELRSLDELMAARREALRKNASAQRKYSEKMQNEKKNFDMTLDILKKDPEVIICRDKRCAQTRLEKAEKKAAAAKEELDSAVVLRRKIEAAHEWYKHAPDTIKQDLKDRQSWKKYPLLDYVNDMNGMF